MVGGEGPREGHAATASRELPYGSGTLSACQSNSGNRDGGEQGASEEEDPP